MIPTILASHQAEGPCMDTRVVVLCVPKPSNAAGLAPASMGPVCIDTRSTVFRAADTSTQTNPVLAHRRAAFFLDVGDGEGVTKAFPISATDLEHVCRGDPPADLPPEQAEGLGTISRF